jgi:hypothetical protein
VHVVVPDAFHLHDLTAPLLAEPAARACCPSGGTSGYRGVSWHSQTCKWKAQIKVNGRDINLGRHKEEADAAKAYDRAAICARGVSCARLNFPIATYSADLDYLCSTPLQTLAAVLR